MVSRWTSLCLSIRPLYVRPSIRISFPDYNLSKHQCIFTKLGMCIDMVEIWFGIANWQISSDFGGLSVLDTPIFSFPDDNISKFQGILTSLVYALILRRSGLGLLLVKFRQFLTVICPKHDNGRVLSFYALLAHLLMVSHCGQLRSVMRRPSYGVNNCFKSLRLLQP